MLTQPRKKRAVAPRALLAQPGSNSKLGHGIASFSLPAPDTCPGRTEACSVLCYARKGHFFLPNVQAIYQRNLVAGRRADFAFRIIKEIRGTGIAAVRIHVSGDFYSAAYIKKWAAIAAACPRVRFFAYTRSWRKPQLLTALRGMAALPNVSLLFSEDRDTGPSPVIPGIRSCFLVATRADEDFVDPQRHALVFRDRQHRSAAIHPERLKRLSGVLVCPHEQQPNRREQKTAATTPPSCTVCGICTRREASRSWTGPRIAFQNAEASAARSAPNLALPVISAGTASA